MKKLSYLLIAVCLVLAVGALSACETGKEPQVPVYTVTFESNGGSQIKSVSGEAGTPLAPLPVPERLYYEFLGWYDITLTERFSASEIPANSITLYAAWRPFSSYIIKFDSGGGSAVKSIIKEQGEPVTAPADPVKEGYVFEGWYRDESLTSSYAFTVMPGGDTVLYAKWERDASKALVTFYGNGKPVSSLFIAINSTLSEADIPELLRGGNEEYEYSGWTDAGGGTFTVGQTPVAADISLHTAYSSKGLEIADSTVTGYTGAGVHVVLPFGVTEIAEFAFAENKAIKTVTLSDTVIKIGNNAFFGCVSLTAVDSLSEIREIGDYAFYNCRKLRSANLISLEQLGDGVFANCEELSEAELGSELTSIGAYAFANCRLLETVRFSNALVSIDEYAFLGCQTMDVFEIPANLYSLGKGALQGCSGIKELSVSPLNSYFVSIDRNVYNKSMSTMLFYQQAGKTETEFTIPDTVTKVEVNAFLDNKNLRHIVIPSSLREARNILSGFDNLNEITLTDLSTISHIAYFYGAVNATDNGKTGLLVPSSLKTVNFTALTEIPDYAFYGCTGLERINGIENVETIGRSAFAYTTLFTAITVNKDLSFIGVGAYEGCAITAFEVDAENRHFITDGSYLYNSTEGVKALIKVLPDTAAFDFDAPGLSGIQTIYDFAFEGCTLIESLRIPATVTSIGRGAFASCTSLSILYMPIEGILDETTAFDSFFGGAIPELDYVEITGTPSVIPKGAFMFSNIKEVVLPESVTTIGEQAFSDNSVLEEITGLNYVTKIEDSAFYYCTALQTIDLGSSLVTLGAYVFVRSGLVSISFPSTLESIGKEAFYYCASLTDIDFVNPASSRLKSIGKWAFLDSSVTGDIVLPASLTLIGDFAFGRTKINSVRFAGETQGDLTVDLWAFSSCFELTSVVFNDNLVTVSEYAFYSCIKLEELELGSNLAHIGNFAFTKCTALRNINFPITLTHVGQDVLRETAWRAAQDDGILYNGNAAVGFKGRLNSSENSPVDVYFESNPYGNDVTITVICSYVLFSQIVGSNGSGYYEFYIDNLYIPEGYKIIGDGAFVIFTSYSSYIKKLHIGASVERIGEFAFAYNKRLEQVVIGSSENNSRLMEIGDCAFADNVALKKLILFKNVENAGELPSLFKDSRGYPTLFERIYATQLVNVTVYVPQESVSIYVAEWRSGIYAYFAIDAITEE